MITRTKKYSSKFDKEIRKYDSPLAKIPPLKMNTVTITWKNQSCQVTFIDFRAYFFKIFMNVDYFTKNYFFGGGNSQSACFLLRSLRSHLNLLEQLSWREIQIDQWEGRGPLENKQSAFVYVTFYSWLRRNKRISSGLLRLCEICQSWKRNGRFRRNFLKELCDNQAMKSIYKDG